MKKSNKIIVIAVLILVFLFGAGQFFASSNVVAPTDQTTSTSPTSTTQTSPTTAPATQVITYVPPVPASATPTENGSCWTNSIAAPFRADAWRCAVGNGISDPCFAIPNSTNTLLCGINPAVAASTSTFVLKLTQPLPQSQPIQGLPPSNWAWLVQLSDGTLCTPFTGTLPMTANGDVANYGCAPSPLGDDVLIFNGLNSSSSVWTAEVGDVVASTSSLPTMVSSTTVPVATVWQ
jgi:hypothetical protein